MLSKLLKYYLCKIKREKVIFFLITLFLLASLGVIVVWHPIVLLIGIAGISFLGYPLLKVRGGSNWISLLIILLYAGGLLVLFLFVVAMSPSNVNFLPLKGGLVILCISPFLCEFPFYNLGSSQEGFTRIITFSWGYLLGLIIILIRLLIFLSAMLLSPEAPMKTV